MTDLNDIDTVYKPYEDTCFSVNRNFNKSDTLLLDDTSLNAELDEAKKKYEMMLNEESNNL